MTASTRITATTAMVFFFFFDFPFSCRSRCGGSCGGGSHRKAGKLFFLLRFAFRHPRGLFVVFLFSHKFLLVLLCAEHKLYYRHLLQRRPIAFLYHFVNALQFCGFEPFKVRLYHDIRIHNPLVGGAFHSYVERSPKYAEQTARRSALASCRVEVDSHHVICSQYRARCRRVSC